MPTYTPTATATFTLTPTPTRTPGVWLNELLAAPGKRDWDGDGRPSPSDEWIELSNPTRKPVDLSGWTLEIIGGRPGKPVYKLPKRLILPAGGFLVLYTQQTRVDLDDAGGEVRLYNAAGALVDAVRYPALKPDTSYSLGPDWLWRSDWRPSPGTPNLPPTPTPTATRTLTPTLTASPTPTATR